MHPTQAISLPLRSDFLTKLRVTSDGCWCCQTGDGVLGPVEIDLPMRAIAINSVFSNILPAAAAAANRSWPLIRVTR
jgi:hypothetical protein